MATNKTRTENTGKRNWWKLAAVALRNIANMLEQIGAEEMKFQKQLRG